MKRVLHRQHAWNEEQMRKLDVQGRHRSEWCYAPYDGRKVSPPKNGAADEIHSKDRSRQHTERQRWPIHLRSETSVNEVD